MQLFEDTQRAVPAAVINVNDFERIVVFANRENLPVELGKGFFLVVKRNYD
jgi:hypothetical protein